MWLIRETVISKFWIFRRNRKGWAYSAASGKDTGERGVRLGGKRKRRR